MTSPITSLSLIYPSVGSTRDVAMENACNVPISQLLSFEWCFFFTTQMLIHHNILASFTPSHFSFVSVCVHSVNMSFLDTLYCVFDLFRLELFYIYIQFNQLRHCHNVSVVLSAVVFMLGQAGINTRPRKTACSTLVSRIKPM